MSSRPVVFCVLSLLAIAPSPRAEQEVPSSERGVTGEVLTPDGKPVTGGTVALMTTPNNRANATIDRAGRFRIVPESQGRHQLFISVPGFAPYRAIVTVSSSRRIALPAITLLEATYFRARFVTTDGDPLNGAGLRRRAVDSDGLLIGDPLDHTREQVEQDGTVTVGPLPLGRIQFAFDRAPLAPTRLPDITVTGAQSVIDRGTITIRPSAQLQVDIVDANNQPVPQHDVWIEEAIQPSPLSFQAVKTNAKGRAVFERLGSGRYRVWTRTAERCRGRQLTIARLASASTTPGAAIRIVISGRAAFRITTPVGPLLGRSAYLSPDAPPEFPWGVRFVDASFGRQSVLQPPPSSCAAVTDSDGRVEMPSFPPGPAYLRVQLFNSSYVLRVNVPGTGKEIEVAIPDGLIPVRVIDRHTQRPVATAQINWLGSGGRVEAAVTANGDALVEGPGLTGGTLTIQARGYQTVEGVFEATPDTQQEVALSPLPAERVLVRAVDERGAALNAVVQLLAGAQDVAEFAATDSTGVATFSGVAPGTLRVTAHVADLPAATVHVPEDGRASIVITLKRAQ